MKTPALSLLLVVLLAAVSAKALTMVTYTGNSSFVQITPDNPWGFVYGDDTTVQFKFSFTLPTQAYPHSRGSYELTGNGVTVKKSGIAWISAGPNDLTEGDDAAQFRLGTFSAFTVYYGLGASFADPLLQFGHPDLAAYINFATPLGDNMDDIVNHISEAQISTVPDHGSTILLLGLGMLALLHQKKRLRAR